MTDDATTTNHHGRTGQRHGIAIGEGAIRRIFPLFVLAMWVTTGVLLARGEWTSQNWVIAAAAGACSLLVFVNFAWVFTFSYAAIAIVLNLLVLLLVGANPAALLLAGLLVVYGVRLLLFLLRRTRHPSYAGRTAGMRAAHQQLPLPVKVLVWVNTTTLYTFEVGATVALARGDGRIGTAQVVGAAVLLVGLLLEATADAQKQRHKRSGSGGWVSTGLFSRSRHPNYLGEILVQVGIVVSVFGVAGGVWGWLAVALAPTYIAILMLSATTGAELAADERYGDDPAYDAYLARTGQLLPRLRP